MLTKEQVKDRIGGWAWAYKHEFCVGDREHGEVEAELEEILEWIEAHADVVPSEAPAAR